VIEHYFSHGQCFAYTQRVLGYPCAHIFGDWLSELQPNSVRKRKNNNHAQAKPVITNDRKKKAVIALCLRQTSAASIATEFGVSREILYKWKAQFLSREYVVDMPKKKNHHESDGHHQLQEQVEDLQQRMYQLQLEHDILRKANELLKKDQGVSHEILTNREKNPD
jgi:putative transposase